MHGRDGGVEGPDDDQLAAASKGVGAGVMGRGMFGGGHGPWDESWEGWWGDKEFLREYRDPANYRVEHPGRNRSHTDEGG